MAFYLVPLATVLCALLAPGVPLLWRQVSIVSSDGARVLSVQYGPWFWVQAAYSYACLASGSIVLLASILRRVRPLTGQGLAFVGAVSLPWLLNALTIFRLVPHGVLDPLAVLDLTPPAIVASAILVAVGLRRLQMFDVFPALVTAAHDALMGELRDGVLVIDGHDRVMEANRAAEELLALPGTTLVGSPLGALLGGKALDQATLSDLEDAGEQRFETVVPGAGGSQCHLEITVSRQGSSPRAAGHVLVLRDVSERVAATESLLRQSHGCTSSSTSPRSASWSSTAVLWSQSATRRFSAMVKMAHEELIGQRLDTARDNSLLAVYQAALRGETASYNGPYTLSSARRGLAGRRGQPPARRGRRDHRRDRRAARHHREQARRAAHRATGLHRHAHWPSQPSVFRDRLRQALAQAARSAANPLV